MLQAARKGVLVHISRDLAQPNITFYQLCNTAAIQTAPSLPQKLMQEVLHFLSLSLHFQNYTCNRSSSILRVNMYLLDLLEAAQCSSGNVLLRDPKHTTFHLLYVCLGHTIFTSQGRYEEYHL